MGRGNWRTATAMVSCSILSGCTTLGLSSPGESAQWSTTLPPAIAAWVAADVCRVTFAGADPVPRHAGAPIVRHAPDLWEIRYDRAPGDGFRVAMNGRLVPPAFLDGEQHPRFAPTSASTAPPRGHESLELSIRGSADGTLLEIHGVGLPIATLEQHLRRAVQLVAGARREMPARDRETGCCAHHGAWLAQLMYRRARAEIDNGRPLTARSWFESALTYDDQHRAARRELAALDGAIARPGEEIAGLASLAASATDPGEAHAANRALRRAAIRYGVRPEPGECERRANELIDAGEFAAALRWARLARARGLDTVALRRTLARLHRQRGEARIAFEFGLEELEDRGYSPVLILALHDDCLSMGDAKQALQLLAHYWSELQLSHAADATDRLRRDVLLTGSGTATRIFMAEGVEEQAHELLTRWAYSGAADSAGLGALSRLPELRASLRDSRRTQAFPGPAARNAERSYELAPGVTPPR